MYNCNVCEKSYSTKYNLKSHQNSIHKEEKHSCEECGKQLTLKHDVTRHINNIHKGIKHKCQECGKEFASAANKWDLCDLFIQVLCL